MHRLFSPNLDLEPITADHGCSSNEYQSLIGRHLVEFTPTNPTKLSKYYEVLKPLLSHVRGIEKMSVRELINSRPQRMRKRYSRGLILDFKHVHAKVNLFIKAEKKTDFDKAPRSIQYRSTPYAARLARYTIPIEKALYKPCPEINGGLPIIAKGLNAMERASVLYEMWSLVSNPVAYLIDHSKFDSAVNLDLLKLEHWFYKQCIPDRYFSYLLKFQEKNEGRTRNGLKYKCVARRMSGDPNTALGNCLINYAILREAFGESAYIFLDGDDSVVVTNGYVKLDLNGTGMTSKVNTVTDFSKIEFCQSQPVQTTKGWIMCREPMRALNRSIYQLGRIPFNLRDYLMTIGIGEGLCSPQMPIIAVLAKKFRSYGGEFKWYFSEYRLSTQKCSHTFELPTMTSRLSFEEAFGIDSYQQLLIEELIKDMVLTVC